MASGKVRVVIDAQEATARLREEIATMHDGEVEVWICEACGKPYRKHPGEFCSSLRFYLGVPPGREWATCRGLLVRHLARKAEGDK